MGFADSSFAQQLKSSATANAVAKLPPSRCNQMIWKEMSTRERTMLTYRCHDSPWWNRIRTYDMSDFSAVHDMVDDMVEGSFDRFRESLPR